MHSQGGYKKACTNMEAGVDQREENRDFEEEGERIGMGMGEN